MAATVNLRAFPFSQQVDCPHCHTQITLYDPSGSEYVVCEHCHSYCKFSAGKLVVHGDVGRIQYNPSLMVGTEGNLKGNAYKVLAYMEKKENGTQYEWREYMLYNYTLGYAFLAEYGGHWNFIAGIQHFPQLATANLSYGIAYLDDKEYLEYNRYTPVITALIGEFDWDVYNERILAREFINPPFMLVREKNKHDAKITDWYLGEYLEPEEVAEAFKVKVSDFPERVDIGENQPNPYKKRWQQSLWISAVAIVIAIAIQIFFGAERQTDVIMNKQVALSLPPPPVTADTAKHKTGLDSLQSALNTSGVNTTIPTQGNFEYQSLRTSSFQIYSGPAPVEVEISAPLDNNWFEATIELVSEKDNQTWDVSRELEFYHGYEDGESWTEGSSSESVVIDDVPAGKYHINIYPYGGTNGIDNMTIKVTANILLWQNILLTILLLCVFPLFCWFYQRRFEVNRWMYSDFSPYKQTPSDDD